jgi:hypothetical protein
MPPAWNTHMRPYRSVFDRIANLVTVRDVYIPFAGEARPDDTHRAIHKRIKSSDVLTASNPFLVETSGDEYSGRAAVYWPHRSDCNSETTIGESAHEFWFNEIVTADTSVLSALALLSNRHRNTVVVDGGQYVGVLRYDDLVRLPGSLCLTSQVQRLEEAATELCKHHADQCWNMLPPDRKELAEQVFYRRFNNKTPAQWQQEAERQERSRRAARRGPRPADPARAKLSDALFRLSCLIPDRQFGELSEIRFVPWSQDLHSLLIECTCFIDKHTLLHKGKWLRSPIKKKTFVRAERLRNLCAHPAPDVGATTNFEPDALKALLAEIADATRLIEDAIPRLPTTFGTAEDD